MGSYCNKFRYLPAIRWSIVRKDTAGSSGTYQLPAIRWSKVREGTAESSGTYQ